MGKHNQQIELNPKYVALLKEAYKKYSQMNYVKVAPQNSISFSSPKECVKKSMVSKFSQENLNSPQIKSIPKQVKPTSIFDGRKSGKLTEGKRSYYSKANNGRKLFSKQEDEFLTKYLKQNPDFEQNKTAKLKDLMIVMNRTYKSIYHRINTLQRGTKTTRKNRPFTLTEDKLIIDEALKQLVKTKSLRETMILDPREFCKKFERNFQAVEQRWLITIRHGPISISPLTCI